uniref:Red chlorophyll catabolite reductase, chloroplastic n=1 Tax=Anthurium amnicola TaxID=1678845 RepID=A0A1D1ZAU2_9ARAE
MAAMIHFPHLAQPLLFQQASPAAWSSPPSVQKKPRKPRPVAFTAAAASYYRSRSPFMSCSASSSSTDPGSSGMGERKGSSSSLMDFPYLSPTHKDLMVDLLVATENRLGPHLLPSSVPPDVLSFQNEPAGTCKGALDIRSGAGGSTVDLILESWLHCELPFGVLDITTLFGFLSAETDAPHLFMEFAQNSPTSLVFFVDLLPRRDLVLHPDYLDHFYQQTPLEQARQRLETAAEVAPFQPSSLYFRGVLSPTAIAVSIDCGKEGARSMEEVMRDHVSGAAKEVTRVWLDTCAGGERRVTGSGDRAGLLERDNLIKTKAVEIDLGSNLPRLFGQDVAGRVVSTIQKAFRI